MKVLVGVLYALAFWLGVPCAIVGTGALLLGVLGGGWWVGLILAPICLAEFIAALSFALDENNFVLRWMED